MVSAAAAVGGSGSAMVRIFYKRISFQLARLVKLVFWCLLYLLLLPLSSLLLQTETKESPSHRYTITAISKGMNSVL